MAVNRRKFKFSNMFAYIFLSVASFISIFPFYWMIISATNTSFDVIAGRLTPGAHLMNNMRVLIERTNFMTAFWNSLRFAVIATVFSLLITSMAGYAFEIYRSRKKDVAFAVLLMGMMIPGTALIVPVFLMFATLTTSFPALGLNTAAAIITPGIASVFLIFFFRQNTKMFSKEILDAARIDGTSEVGLFFRMFLPIMKNAFAAAGIIAFMASWNAFMWPMIVVRTPSMQTIPIVLNLATQGYVVDFGLLMLMSFLSVIPIALVFFILQKQFVAGMVGTFKG